MVIVILSQLCCAFDGGAECRSEAHGLLRWQGDCEYSARMSDEGLAPPTPRPKQHLSLLDTTCIIVGIIIGASIYEMSPTIAYHAAQPAIAVVNEVSFPSKSVRYPRPQMSPEEQSQVGIAAVIAVWTLGGIVALVGALCYAELATTYPREGGTYIFLRKAFGSSMAFSFAWIEFWIIRPGNIGALAYVFARYAAPLAQDFAGKYTHMALASGAILALSVVNLLGVRLGTWTQNVLTIGKILGLAVIAIVAFSLPAPAETTQVALDGRGGDGGSLTLALILVMFAYGGWSDMSYVAAEVRNPSKNIARALILGTLVVTAIYLTVNIGFIRGLGLDGFFQARTVAADVLRLRFGAVGGRAISLLICLSCLGAINGMIFTGARVYYAIGAEHRMFAWLGTWNERLGVPVRSLVLQGAVTIGLVIAFGLYKDGFQRLVVFTGPFFWGFFALVAVALVVLRDKDAGRVRTFRVPLYPLTPLVFGLSSLGMAYSALDYSLGHLAWEASWAVVVIAAGLAVFLFEPLAVSPTADR